jgi:hypothetical protein
MEPRALHCGLGTSHAAKFEVQWPSGIRQMLNDIHIDQFLEIIEPENP